MSSQDDWLVDPKSNRFIDTYMRGYLDMSGGHLILRNNDIYVNDGDISLNGKLLVTGDASMNSKLFVANDVCMNELLMVGNDVSLNSKLFVADDVSMNETLHVGNNVIFDSKLLVEGDASFNSNVDISGNLVIRGTLGVYQQQEIKVINTTVNNYQLIVTEDISLNGKLYVKDDVSLNSKLFVADDVCMNEVLMVGNDVSFNSDLFVDGDLSLNGDLSVDGDTRLNTLYVRGWTVLRSTLDVSKNVTFGSTLDVSGATNVRSTLDVSGVTNLASTLKVSKAATLSSTLAVTGASTMGSTLKVDDTLTVSKASILSSTLNVAKASTLKSTLKVSKATTLSSTLAVTGASTMGSTLKVNDTLTVSKASILSSTLNVANASTLCSTLAVTGASTLSSTLRVAGASTIDNTLKVNDTLTVSKASTLSSTLTVANASILKSTLKVSNATTLSSTLYVANDVSMDTVVTIGGDVSLNNKLYVASDVSMDSILMVGGDVSMNSKLTVHDDVTVENGGITTNDISLNVSNLPFFATGAFTDNQKIVYSKFSNSDRILNGLYDISASSVQGVSHPWNVADSTSLLEWVSASGTGTNSSTNVTYIDNAVSTTVNGEYIQFAFPFHIKLNQYVINTNNSVKDVRLIGFKDSDFYHINTFTYGTKGGTGESDTIPIDTSFYSNLFRVVFPQNSNNTSTISVISLSFSGDVIGSKVNIDNGNIGIGNVNPRSALEITGNMVLSNATSGINNSGENQEHGRITWAGIGRDISDNHSSYIRSYFEDETYDTSGNLAFGTSDGTTIAEDRFIIHSTGKNEFITDVSMDSGLFVGGDVSLNSKLYVSGAATMGSTLNVNDTLTVSKASILSSTLDVAKASTLKSTINVSKAATLSSTLAVTGASTMGSTLKVNDTLTVSKTSTLSSTLDVANAATLKSTFNVSKAATLSSTLKVTGASTMGSTLKVNDTLTVSKASTLSSTLDVAKASTLKSTFKVSKAATLSSTLAVTGASTMGSTLKVNDTLTVSKASTLKSTLNVSKAATLSSTLAVTGASTMGSTLKVNDTLTVSKASSLSSTLDVAKASTLKSTLKVSKAATLSSTLTVTGASTMSSTLKVNDTLTVSKASSLSSTLDVAKASTLKSTLKVSKAATLSSTLAVTGASTMGSTLKVNDTLTVSKASTLSSTLDVAKASTLKSTLNVSKAAALSSTLEVTGASTMGSTLKVNDTLTVSGDTSLNGELYVNNTITVSGNILPMTHLTHDIGSAQKSFRDIYMSNGTMYNVDSDGNTNSMSTDQGIITVTYTDTVNSITTKHVQIGSVDNKTGMGGLASTDASFTLDIQGNLRVTQDVSLNSTLHVGGASTMGSTLKVNDTLTVSKASTLSSTLDVAKASTLKSTLKVSKAATLSSTLNVAGESTMSTLTVANASVSSKLEVIGDVSINSLSANHKITATDLSINNDVVIHNNAVIGNSDLSYNEVLTVIGKVVATDFIIKSGAEGALQLITSKVGTVQLGSSNTPPKITTVQGVAESIVIQTGNSDRFTIDENGNTTFSNDVSMNAGLEVSNKLLVAGASTMGSTLKVNDTLTVSKASTLNSTLYVTKAATLSSTLDVSKASTLKSTLAVSKAATLSSTLDVTGATTIGSTLKVNDTLSVSKASTLKSTLAVSRATTLSSTLNVMSDVSMNAGLVIGGKLVNDSDVSMNAGLEVGGDVSLNSNVTVNGDLQIYGKLDVNQIQNTNTMNTTVNEYTLVVTEDLSINGGLSVSEDLSLNGSANISNKIIVDKDGDVTITNQTIVIGNSIYLSSVIGGSIFDNIIGGNLNYTQSFANFTYTISASSYNGSSNANSVASAFVNNNSTWKSDIHRYVDDTTSQLVATTTNPVTTSYFPNITDINDSNSSSVSITGEYIETILPYPTTIDSFEIHTDTYQVPTLGVLLANSVNSSGVDVWVKLIDYNNTTITDDSLLRDTKFSLYIPIDRQFETTKLRFIVNNINKLTNTTKTFTDFDGNQQSIYQNNVSIRYINFSGLVQNAGISVGAGYSQNTANTSMGFATLANNIIGKNNIALGNYALSQTTNNDNIAVGYNSLIANTTGDDNIGIGSNALLNNSSGKNNTALGSDSGSYNDAGVNNTFIGTTAGYSNRYGDNNTFVGYNTDISGTHSHSTAIGADAKITGDNQIVIGTTSDNVKIPGTIELSGTFSGDISFNDDIKVAGSTILKSTLNVTNATTLNNTLNVGGKTTLTTLDVNSVSNFKSNVTVTSGNTFTSDNIIINGTAILNNTLSVTNATTLNNTLSVTGATTLKSTLNVTGQATLQSRLDVAGDVSLNQKATIKNLNVTENTHTNTLTTAGASTINGKLTVAPTQDINLANKFIMTHGTNNNITTITDTTIKIFNSGSDFIRIENNKMIITGATNNTEVLDITGTITTNAVLLKAGGTVTTTGDTATTSRSTIIGDASNGMGMYPLGGTGAEVDPYTGIKFTPYIGGADTNIDVFTIDNSGNTNIAGELTIDNSLNVTSNSTLTNLKTAGDTSLNNLQVINATTLDSTLIVNNATTLSSTLNVTGTTTLSDVTVTDATNLSSTLNVSNATTLSSTLNVTGSSTFNDTLTVSKETALNSDVDISGNVSVSHGQFTVNDISFNVTNLPISITNAFTSNQKILYSQYSDSERVFNNLYDISASSVYQDSIDNQPWKLFDGLNTSIWKSGANTGTSSNTDVRYVDSGGTVQGISGEYVQITFPFYIKLSEVIINAFDTIGVPGILIGYLDNSFNYIGETTGGFSIDPQITTSVSITNSFYSDTFRIVFEENVNNATEINLSEISFDGDVVGSKVHIDNGNLGVGTTDPRSALEVTGDMVISKPINGENTSGDSVEHGRIVWAGIGRDISNNNHSSYIRSYFENGTYDTSGNLAFGTSDGTTVANDRFVINANGINNFITDVSMDSNLAVNGDVSFNSNLYIKEKVWVDGTVGIGTSNPVVVFDINDTGALRIPVGESNQRPIDITGASNDTSYYGSIRYNTNNTEFEGYGPGGTWNALSGVNNISKNTKITAAEPTTAGTNNELKFYTASAGSTTTGETQLRMIIKNTGDISMNHKLSVAGEVRLNSKLDVTGASTMGSTLKVNDTLTVSKASTLSSTLDVANASTLKSTLKVSKAATLSSTLAVTGASTMGSTLKVNDTLTVSKASTLSSTLDVSKASTLKSTLKVSGASTLSSTLAVTGASTMGSTLKVNDTLTVSKASTLSSTLDVAKASTLKSTLKVSGASTLSSTLDVTGAATMGSTLKVDGDVSMNANADILGNLIIKGRIGMNTQGTPVTTLDISATDAIRIPVGLTSERPTNQVYDTEYYGSIRYNTNNSQFEGYGPGGAWGSLGGVINVAQTTKILAAEPNADSTNNQLTFYTDNVKRMVIDSNGDVSMGYNLSVSGAATMSSTLTVDGKTTLSDDVSMNADVDISGNLVIKGNLSVFQTKATETINTTVNDYTLIVTEDISLNGTLISSKDISVNSITVGRGSGDISTNTVVGYQALDSNTEGSNNIAVGFYAGDSNTSGSRNTYIGSDTTTNDGTYNDSTAIGYGASITASNQIVLGRSSETVVVPGDISLNGTPYAPTASFGDESNQIATTEFVSNALTVGVDLTSNQTITGIKSFTNGIDISGSTISPGKLVYYINQLGQTITTSNGDIRVSINQDGTIVALGDYKYSSNKGRVQIYQYNSTNSNWSQLGGNLDGDSTSEYHGFSLSLSSDGHTVAIGAYGADEGGSDKGRVRVYDLSANSWNQVGSNIVGVNDSDQIGSSVSLSSNGSIVAVGGRNYNDSDKGVVRVYEYVNDGTSSSWTKLGEDIDGENSYDYSGGYQTYGQAVSLSADGHTVAIGAYDNDDNGGASGHVRVYEYSDNNNDGTSTWNLVGSDIDGEAAGDYSGFSVSLSSDGSIVAIGAYRSDSNTGHVRVFGYGEYTQSDYDAGTYYYNSQTQNSSHTKPLIITENDTAPVVGNSYWMQLGQDIDGEAAGDYSGISVSLSSDGSIVAIGSRYANAESNDAGHVRVYRRDTTTTNGWTQIGPDIDGPTNYYSFGTSVSLSADGSTVAISSQSTSQVKTYKITSTMSIEMNTLSVTSINSLTVGRGGGNIDTNTAFGYQALTSNTTGYENTAIGYNSGSNCTTGLSNTFIGSNTGFISTTNYSNSTALGRNAKITAHNQIMLGTNGESVVAPWRMSIGTTSTSYKLNVNGDVNADSYNASSDYRIKENIVPISDTSYNIDNLRPVTYTNTKMERQDFGVIAHEIQEQIPFLVTGEKDGEHHQSVNYNGLIGLLLNEVQQLKKRVNELERSNP
ncbi:tail fiber domain-containing protein [Pelagibacteraceae bacterium]|nr:tail fiber domain-containing protein [Pelagibacteraceae bacterium]